MSGSMNVRSLIEEPPGTPQTRPPSQNHPQQQPALQPAPQPAPPPAQLNPGLLALLGPNVTEFPLSEAAYVEALRLRVEQERTKQEYYRHETAHKKLMILDLARQAQVPPHLIPYMCGPVEDPANASPRRQLAVPSGTRSPMPPQAYLSPHDNASPVPPQQFRFGGAASGPAGGTAASGASGSASGSTARRPLSPAKLGAAAVASLATPTAPYRGASVRKKHPLHHRHYSLPSEFPSPKRKPAALTIQVKPVPAQPLMKQNLSQPPSQESMTSFQHVIQFQHWRPEDGDHKRQKSLLVREDDDDDDDEDISMSHSRRPSDIPSQIS